VRDRFVLGFYKLRRDRSAPKARSHAVSPLVAIGQRLPVSATKEPIPLVDKEIRRSKARMKRVLVIKTPVGGVVHIIPREDTNAAVGLTWKERNLTDLEKEACRQYLLEEGFMEHAAGIIEPDAEIEQFLKEIPDIV
jgi:hypothetical protein